MSLCSPDLLYSIRLLDVLRPYHEKLVTPFLLNIYTRAFTAFDMYFKSILDSSQLRQKAEYTFW